MYEVVTLLLTSSEYSDCRAYVLSEWQVNFATSPLRCRVELRFGKGWDYSSLFRIVCTLVYLPVASGSYDV